MGVARASPVPSTARACGLVRVRVRVRVRGRVRVRALVGVRVRVGVRFRVSGGARVARAEHSSSTWPVIAVEA